MFSLDTCAANVATQRTHVQAKVMFIFCEQVGEHQNPPKHSGEKTQTHLREAAKVSARLGLEILASVLSDEEKGVDGEKHIRRSAT